MAAKSTAPATTSSGSRDVYTPKAVTEIDRRTCHRVVPMKVLVLGLSRTGTNCKCLIHPSGHLVKSFLAIRMALELLGYDETYHGYNAVFCLDGMRAKFEGKGKLFGKEEFDQLLGHCQVSISQREMPSEH